MLLLLLLCLFGPFINAQELPPVECWDCEVNGDGECSSTCQGQSCISIINMSTSKLIKVTCSDINTNGCTSNLETEKLSCYCQSDHCNDPNSKQSSNDSVGNETKFDYGDYVLHDDTSVHNDNQDDTIYYSANVLTTDYPSSLYETVEELPEDVNSENDPVISTFENDDGEVDSNSNSPVVDDVDDTTVSSDNALDGYGTDDDMVFIFNEGSSPNTETPTIIVANPSSSSDSLDSLGSVHILNESVPVTEPWWEADYDPVPAVAEEETILSEPVPDPQVVLDDPPPDPSPTSPPTSQFANVEKALDNMNSVANDNFRGSNDPIMRNIFNSFRERNELLRKKLNELHAQ